MLLSQFRSPSLQPSQLLETFDLRDTYILNSGAIIYIYNDKSRMANIRQSELSASIYAGDQRFEIICFGTVILNVTINGTPSIIELLNVAYVPSVYTNVTNLNIMVGKGCDWSILKGRITRHSQTICGAQRKHGRFVLKYKPISEQAFAFLSSSFAPGKPTKASILTWHKRLEHLGSDALKQRSYIEITSEFKPSLIVLY